jgi:hypothetical protein
VAVSGGIDSVALLRLLLELRYELGIVLSVVHFNHKLRRAESEADEEFVRNLAREHDLELYVDRADVAGHAREEGVSVETAARELRYEFFRSLIRRAKTVPEVEIPTLSQNAREGWGNHVQVPTSRKSGEPVRHAEGGPWDIPSEDASQGRKPRSQQASSRGAEAPLFHKTYATFST